MTRAEQESLEYEERMRAMPFDERYLVIYGEFNDYLDEVKAAFDAGDVSRCMRYLAATAATLGLWSSYISQEIDAIRKVSA